MFQACACGRQPSRGVPCCLVVPVFGIGSARWPDGPPQSGVAHGFSLIPVSGVGDAVGGASEAVGDERQPKRVINSGVRVCAARKSARVCVR